LGAGEGTAAAASSDSVTSAQMATRADSWQMRVEILASGEVAEEYAYQVISGPAAGRRFGSLADVFDYAGNISLDLRVARVSVAPGRTALLS
jgi:hypothetical protein